MEANHLEDHLEDHLEGHLEDHLEDHLVDHPEGRPEEVRRGFLVDRNKRFRPSSTPIKMVCSTLLRRSGSLRRNREWRCK